jgi:hypothetical protein
MTRRLATLLAPLVLLAPLATQAQEKEGTPLFNGKDLTGWTAVLSDPNVKADEVWSVEDGILKCKGKPAGYIRTDRDDYKDYVLTVDWRWPAGTEGGNNGVLIHASKPAALGIWPRSLEVQLFKDNAGDFWVIPDDMTIEIPNQAERQKGRRHLNLTDGAEKPIGEWNTIEITARGGSVTVKVNGDLVNEGKNCSDTQGAICLQSEGAPIEYRNIVLRPLAD